MCKIRSFRARKDAARADLHKELQISAFYYASATSTPVPCKVRVWTSWAATGVPQNATSDGWSEREETSPKIVFLRSEVPNLVDNTSYVTTEENEAYRLMSKEAPYNLTIVAKAVALLPSDPLRSSLAYPLGE